MITFECGCGDTRCSPGFCLTHDTVAVAAPVMTPALMGLEIQEAIMALYELRPSLDVWATKQLEDAIERLNRVQHLLEGND
jgi:hypothetical protein